MDFLVISGEMIDVKEQLVAFYWLMNKYGVVYSFEGTLLSTLPSV